MTGKLNLLEFRANTHSQDGEDGILHKLFETLGVERGVFCEFGAWDGIFLSNVYSLCRRGWRGCYIESDEERYQALVRNVARPDVVKIRARVSPSGENGLDHILSRSGLFRTGEALRLDLLSIDIDSDDLAVWRSVTTVRPTVVVIEYNPTIPIDVFFENPPGKNQGNAARSIFEYACTIGYRLVAATGANLVFVKRDVDPMPFRCFELADPDLALGSRYFFGYDGTLITKRAGRSTVPAAPEIFTTPWNGALFSQPVRRPFRRYGQGRGMHQLNLLMSAVAVGVASPLEAARAVWNRMRRR
jgi:hypothetical protein